MLGTQEANIGVLAVLRRLSPDARFFIYAMALTRLAGFMVFPFLTVILNQQLGASIAQIGALFTIGAFIGLATSPIAGFIADAMPKRTLMLWAVGITIACFLALAFFRNLHVYYVVITVFSVTGGILEPLLRASLGDLAEDEAQRPALFHVRYYIVNIAGAIGPFLGLWFVQNGSAAVFVIAAASYVLLAYAVLRKLREPAQAPTKESRGTHWAVVREVFRHKLFVGLFFSNFLLVFIYTQTDEPLTFHMIELGVPDIAAIIAILTFTNTVVVLVLHGLFMNRILALGEQRAFVLAIVCLGLSLLMIGLNTSQVLWLWVVAIAVSTLGEIIAMPLFLTIVDRVAPKDQRNSFFGVYMLSNIGGGVAPFLAAQVITEYGGTVLFMASALCCIPLALVGFAALRSDAAPPHDEVNHESV
ncbi:MAG: MFS transporter [Sulfitobacter sp.]